MQISERRRKEEKERKERKAQMVPFVVLEYVRLGVHKSAHFSLLLEKKENFICLKKSKVQFGQMR